MQPEYSPRRWIGYLAYLGLNAVAVAFSVPFATQAELSWPTISLLLCAGTIAIALADLWHLAINFSARNAVLFAILALGISWLAEYTGIRWGFPFGARYDYHAALRPMLPGDVPLLIPLAWFVLAQGPLVVFRQWSVVNAQGTIGFGRLLCKASACAGLLVLYDMTLEPLAMQFDLWKWAWDGSYFGTPYRNFLGWFVVGLTIYASYLWCAARSGRRDAYWPLVNSTWSVAALAFLSLVGLALMNRIGSPLPAVIAWGLVGLHACYWYASSARQRPPEGPTSAEAPGRYCECNTRSAAARCRNS